MKKKLVKWILLSNLAFVLTTTSYSSIPNHDNNPTTFLGPTVRAQYTVPLLNTTTPFWAATGISLLGEAGPRNYRAGGTIGFGIDCVSRVKFTGEYLWQELNYSFFSGNTHKWVQQGAIGGTYQYDLFTFYNFLMPQFDLNAYYSHAPNKNLSTVNGTFINNDGVEQPFTEQRRIAGSDAYGISPGLRIQPWWGSQVRAFLNYDNVNYHKRFSPNEDVSGFGGTVGINQTLFCNLNLDAFASVRKPFNEYGGSINYINLPFYGLWTVGIFGNYTDGKNTLPNSYNIGLGISYFVEPCCLAAPVDYKNEHGKLIGVDPAAVRNRVLSTPDNLMQWIADPAVYMPQVLAIPDSQVTLAALAPCIPAILVSPIPAPPPMDTTNAPNSETVATAQSFGGNNLTFSETHVTALAAGSATVSIDPSTGVVTISATTATSGLVTVTVTASNACGSASSTFAAVIFSTD